MKSFTNRGGHYAKPMFCAFMKALLSVMLLLVGNVAVKAQTEKSDFVFNDNVRYSQWVINSRLNDFYANTTKVGLATYDEAGNQKENRVDGKTTLDYVPGLVAKGVIEAAQYYSAYPWAKPWFLSVADYGNQFYNTTENTGGSLDNLNAVKLYITLSELAKTGGVFENTTAYNNANAAIGRAITGLQEHNTKCSIGAGTLAGDDVIGGWWHKIDYNNQMWLDGQYMGTALLAQISKFNGKRTNISTSTDDFDIVYNQLKMVWDKCWNPTDKLMYHAFDANAGTNSNSNSDTWAGLSSTEPYVFHSQTYWARACGWYFLALVDVLEAMESVKTESAYSAKYNEIKGWMTALAAGLKARQDATTGGWYQILDKDGSYSASKYNNNSYTETYNYIESSATAIFAAAYLKAINLGYLQDNAYGETAKKAYRCIVNHFFASDGNGGMNIFGSCRSAGLGGKGNDYKSGGKKFRDGSNAYYLLGSDVARVAKSENVTEGKVLGAFILAAAEYEKLYMKDNTVLLTKDLASSYELEAGNSLTVEASDANVSYQWYDATTDNAISAATSASYAPTASGSYYCVVTPATKAATRAATESVKTSTADVTVNGESGGGDDNITGTFVTLPAADGSSLPTGYSCDGTVTTPNGSGYNMNGVKCYNLAKDGSCTITVPANILISKIEIIGTCSSDNLKTSSITVSDCKTTSDNTLNGRKGDIKKLVFTPTEQKQAYTVTSSDRSSWIQIKIYTTSSSTDPTPTTYTVTYSANGHGTAPAEKTGVTSLTQEMLDVTINDVDGYTFKGWYTDVDCTTAATTIETLTGDVKLFAKWESSETTPSIEGGILDGTTLTVSALAATEAGKSQTLAVTLPAKASATVTSNNATFADGKLTYTAPDAGQSMNITLEVTAEDGTTTDTYIIKIVTEAVPGSMAEYTATFTLDQMKTFGSRNNDTKTITSDDNALTLGAVAGTTSGKNIESTGLNTGGAKMQSTSSFILTPTIGVKVKKVSVYTTTSKRWLTSTPSATAEQSASDKTLWEYTFNSIEEAITFKNANTDNINVLRINVLYEKTVEDGKTALSAKFSEDELSWYVNDEKPTEPTLTVTAAGAAFTGYNVEYTSSNAGVVTVNKTTGVLEVKGSGTAVITAKVTPTGADKYVGTSVAYTVNVKPLEVPTVYAHDITVYNTTGVQPQPVVDIYVTDADGKRIVLDKRYYTLSYNSTGDNNSIFVGTNGTFVLAGEPGNWTTGSAVVTVTCEPNDEAAKLYHITEGTADFNVSVVSTGGKLVPTLGGVTTAKMNAGNTRDFVKAVLYDGVDITEGFTYTVETTDDGVSKSEVSVNNGVITLKAGTLSNGNTTGTVTIKITATPNTESNEQYTEVTGTIVVTVGEYDDFTSVEVTPTTLEKNVGDVLQDFEVVVTDKDGNPIPEDDYTMVWGSSAPGVVAVVGDRSQGIFNALSEGKAIIRVYIQKEGYADMKGECTVTVKDAGKRAITLDDEHEIGKEFKVDGLILTLGGWMFSGTVDDLGKYGTTTETFSNTACKWGKPNSGNNKPVGFTCNITMGEQKNARQEFGSNCQPESNGIYNGTIKEQTTKVIDPMFNVPCYGAYFALAPMTTGTVTVYVRQNGVFDDANKTGYGVYRPQRRVFVMDEMGGHVTSTPKLEFPTGLKAKTQDVAKFDCDLFGLENLTKTGTDEEISTWVKSHFVGLQDFNISDNKITNFKNGVYASNLSTDITHNQAQINRTNADGVVSDASARGWSVLSVAPVSYTFDVKPGKTYYIYNFGSKLGLYGFVFRKGTPTVDENTWSETETPKIAKTEADHVAKVSIDREFVPGIWNACVLPFSMNRQQIGEVFGPCYDKNNPEGTQILYFDHTKGSTIHFVRHAYNTIVAGKPFLIKPAKKEGTIQIKSENMGDYPYVTIESTAAEDFGLNKESADYYWTSSYGNFEIAPGDYFLRDTEINGKPADGNIVRYPVKQTATLQMKGFRGYLTARTPGLRQSAKSLTIAINDFENNETTYIENVEIAEDGTLRQRLSGKVYNLQGQLVSDDASQLNSLPKGIYIVNGTKVSVK